MISFIDPEPLIHRLLVATWIWFPGAVDDGILGIPIKNAHQTSAIGQTFLFIL